MPECSLRENLKNLLESMERPALLVQLQERLVLFSNSAAVREYGVLAREGQPIELPLAANTADCFYSVDPDRDDLLCCRRQTVGSGRLQLSCFSADLGVLVESASSGRRLSSSAPAPTPSYHVSYIHDLISGRRRFSDTEVLTRLGLADPAEPGLGLDWRRLILPEDRSLFDNTMAAARRHGGNHALRYRMHGADGDVVEICDFCGVTQSEADSWPMLVGSVLSGDDGYRRIKQAERHALVGQLAGGMVHDFKNLLGGMQNMIEWCISQTVPDSEVAEALNRIVSYTDQATSLVSGALAVIGGKQGEEKVEEIDLGELVNGMAVLLRHLMSASTSVNIEINSSIPRMYGTRGLLQNLLLNICINARDAMKKSGDSLSIVVDALERDDEHGQVQQCVVLRIADNGCGMSQEKLASVFDAFYSTKPEGAGLGLWMVKEATRAFDGKIEVSSREGEGTCFEIVFPAADGSRATQPALVATTAVPRRQRSPVLGGWDGQNRTLLFVEDDPLLRNGVCNWLKAMNFKVICAEDGPQGIAMFEQHCEQLDLIIQDMVLPGIRGDELLKHFKHKLPALPVIVSSALPDDDSLLWMRDQENVYFLPKPFKIETLIGLFHEIFTALPSLQV